MHNFNKSSKTEKKYSHLHNEVYNNAFMNINNSPYQLRKIDRDSCDYKTQSGKEYQTGDVDTLLHIAKGDFEGVKKVSEKVRQTIYNDLYIEIISVFEKKDGKYQISSLGWGNKENPKNKKNTPDYLSYICLDKKNNKYSALFLPKYKVLKERLFFLDNCVLPDLLNEQFLEYIEKCIANKEEENKKQEKEWNTSFSMKVKDMPYNNIIFAKNKNGNSEYYTIGITFSLDFIKSLQINILPFSGLIDPKKQMTNSIKK